MDIEELVRQSHAIAFEHGFWDDPREFGTCIALVHSELSEALEGHRTGDMANVAEELADVVIRVADLCGHLGIDLETEIIEKLEKNRLRPHKHGKGY